MYVHLGLIVLLVTTDAYNIDTRNNVKILKPEMTTNSTKPIYFGYSLKRNYYFNKVAVGAPRSNTLTDIPTGAVYVCDDDYQKNLCKLERYDRVLGGDTNRNFSNAWLGASIAMILDTDMIMFVNCGPRYTRNNLRYDLMNGICIFNYKLALFMEEESKQIAKEHNSIHYIYDYGMGLFGFSVHVTKDKNFVIGAPGVYKFTGTTIFLDKNTLYDEPIIPDVSDNVELSESNYFGYSITSGYFYGDHRKKQSFFATGAPRSSLGLGKVIIYSFGTTSRRSKVKDNIVMEQIFNGEQIGEYFGSSLTACDVNGDDRDDLIIGAPQWSSFVDEGRVYVELSDGQRIFNRRRINGNEVKGRFGTTVLCLGDLDHDRYMDVAVGAPYEDENRGAVYIYSGSVNGLREPYTQRIRAIEISHSLRGFGFSISEKDYMDNALVVGAYLSDQAVAFSIKPVITLKVKIRTLDNFILTENVTNFDVHVCIRYDGPYTPETVDVTFRVVVDEYHRRVIIYQNGFLYGNVYKRSVKLKREMESCKTVKITVKKDIQNKIDTIDFTANVTIDDGPNCNDCIAIKRDTSNVVDQLKLAYSLDCGDDNVCHSDLQLNVTSDLNFDDRFTIGTKSNVDLKIFITNLGEPAYNAQLRAKIPDLIPLARIPTECYEMLPVNDIREIICKAGNPLRYNNTLIIELDMSNIHYSHEFAEIEVYVTTQSEDINLANNNKTFKINFDVDANVTVVGQSFKNLYEVNILRDNDVKKSYRFTHVYEIWKLGVTPIEEVIIEISVPIYWKDIRITHLHQIQGLVNEQPYLCENLTINRTSNLISHDRIEEIFYKENDRSMVIPPEERTFYLNCTNSDVVCQQYQCNLGPFLKMQSVAQLAATIDFHIYNLTAKAVEGKDIIFFVSEGLVQVIKPNITIDYKANFKQISTIFLSINEPEKIALWIIIASILLGLILLILASLLLYKFGFFSRKKKDELVVLKSKEEENHEAYGNENAEIIIQSKSYEEL